MQLDLWGVRGTIPSPGADKVRYGGHTMCSSIKLLDGSCLVVDAGTGIKDLGDALMKEAAVTGAAPRVVLLLTHFHLDHIMGFPFFAPLYAPGAIVTIYSPVSPAETEGCLAGLMGGWYYPLEMTETAAEKTFFRFGDGLKAGGVRITSCPLHHPGGSVAYRLDVEEPAGAGSGPMRRAAGTAGGSVVFSTDTEPPDGKLDERLAGFARGAGLMISDAMYTPEEYASGKKGWGHSTWLEAVKTARAAGVERLLLSHFNPDHDDAAVDDIARRAAEALPGTAAARQGMILAW